MDDHPNLSPKQQHVKPISHRYALLRTRLKIFPSSSVSPWGRGLSCVLYLTILPFFTTGTLSR